MLLLQCTLLACWFLPAAPLPESAPRAQPAVHNQPKIVHIKIGYYLNDRERPGARGCDFEILADSRIVKPLTRDGDTFSYLPNAGVTEVVLRCDGRLLVSRLDHDLFAGGNLVVGVLTAPERLDQPWSPPMPVPADKHYGIVFGYDAGRFALREKWLKLPTEIRLHIRTAYVIVFQPTSGSRVGTQWTFVDFR